MKASMALMSNSQQIYRGPDCISWSWYKQLDLKCIIHYYQKSRATPPPKKKKKKKIINIWCWQILERKMNIYITEARKPLLSVTNVCAKCTSLCHLDSPWWLGIKNPLSVSSGSWTDSSSFASSSVNEHFWRQATAASLWYQYIR